MPRFLSVLLLLLSGPVLTAQHDTIYLMNGHYVVSKVLDTLLQAVTVVHPKKAHKKIHYEFDQLYMVKFENGKKRFYYRQDTAIGNWLTRREMWMYMKGERDARRGFRARGSFVTAAVAGFAGGATGTIWGPLAPYGFMMLTGIPRVRIRHSSVSDPRYLDSDAYVLGYERVARQRRKIRAVVGGTIGLVLGYGFYWGFHAQYPEQFDLGG